MSQRLNVLTAELQNEVMKTRMQPIGNVLTKFNRVVRDLGRELSKKIDLELKGTDTELDKTILEAIKDPLTHIVRNAIDHGIESPAERLKCKKKETGKITIHAYHESGQVIIEVSDDGGGINRERVLEHAIKNQVISKDAVAKLSDWEIIHLIFTPGFSTAKSVSNLSGRGVGMDVVKTNVERIGGIVEVQSVMGEGSSIRLKIPLTLAIVPALLVKVDHHRFAIPQSRLVELLRINPKDREKDRIENLQGKRVLRLRNKILPLLELSEIIHSKDVKPTPIDSDVINIIILNSDKFQFGLIVSEIEDSTDIVVKPLAQFLKEIIIFSGASIMGDGNVALTLDVTGIAQSLLSFQGNQTKAILDPQSEPKRAGHLSEKCDFLMVNVGGPGHYAIPLTVVSRLEEVPFSQIEYSGEQKILRYREQIIPILSLSDALKFRSTPHNTDPSIHRDIKLIVVRRGDYLYGIEVNEIIDIVSYEAKIDGAIKDRVGVIGTLLAHDRVIVIIDVFEVIDSFRKQVRHESVGDSLDKTKYTGKIATNINKQHRILVIDDSSFFRSHISQILQNAGYLTELACDGSEGLSSLEKGTSFDLVLSDIEMPVMDGLELVKKIRQSKSLSSLPVIALTTNFSAKAIENGLKAGFNSYLEKLNPEVLLNEIKGVFNSNQEGKQAYATAV
jgi:two-component system chemotaxis sensor kinase CheA